MNINLRHWTGTLIVAAIAGFVIFGLLRGSEILNGFLKSEPIDANLERGELLEQIQLSPTPSITPTSVKPLVSTKTPAPSIIMSSPLPTGLTQTFSPAPTPTSVSTFMPMPTSTTTPTPSPIVTQAVTPTPTPTPIQQVQCGPEQVDINLASKEELLKIKHIGNARADELITLRPFSSVDDMTRITGIGPTRLQDIKYEGIACVE